MRLYTFKAIYTTSEGYQDTRIYTKFCNYPKKTKLYRSLKYLKENILILDNEQSEFLEWLLNNYEKEYYFNRQDKTHAKEILTKLNQLNETLHF